MNTITPDTIKQFFEQAAKANADAWAAQASYFDSMVKRNSKCFTALADARVTSLREMAESKTFNQAFEANLAFEETLRDELGRLQDDNVKAWENLQSGLKTIYTPVAEAARAESPAKPAPKKTAVKSAPKKPVARKTAPKPKKSPARKAVSPKAASPKAASPKAKPAKPTKQAMTNMSAAGRVASASLKAPPR